MRIIRIFCLLFPSLLLAYVLVIRSHVLDIFYHNEPLEILADMDHQAKYKPQEGSNYFKDHASIRPPVDTTYPRYDSKYEFHQTEFDSAEIYYKESPFSYTEKKYEKYLFMRGKNSFDNYCVYCHNNDGSGNGPIITKVELRVNEEPFPGPPSLLREQTVNYSDARLFHILSAGQNLMFPVSDKLSEYDRWIVVQYIRYLQKKK